METSFPWNVALFNLINAPKAPNEIVVMMAKGLAIFFPWLVLVVFILMWVSGTVVVCLGLATAWARVYLGVHFPLDMAAAFIISLFAAIVARTISEKLDGGFFQSVERMNTILSRPFLRQRDNDNER